MRLRQADCGDSFVIMSYCRDDLLKVCAQCKNTILDKRVLCSIRLSNIARRLATHRGCRGGLKHTIPIIVTQPTLRPPAPRGNGHNQLNVVDVNLKPNHAEHKQALNIGLVNCQSIVNKTNGPRGPEVLWILGQEDAGNILYIYV